MPVINNPGCLIPDSFDIFNQPKNCISRTHHSLVAIISFMTTYPTVFWFKRPINNPTNTPRRYLQPIFALGYEFYKILLVIEALRDLRPSWVLSM